MDHSEWWQTYMDRWSAMPFHDLIAAAAILGTALLLGLIAARLACQYVLPALTPKHASGISARLAALTRAGVAALVLTAFLGIGGMGPGADLLLAAGLGIAVAALAYGIFRLLGVRSGPGILIATTALFIVLASRLGGLAPLIEGLDGASIGIGARRISLLDIVNTVGLSLLLFVAARALLRWVLRWIGQVSLLDAAQRVLFQKVAQIAVVTLAIFLGIDLLGIDLTALAVFSGAFGLAVGFGLQKTLGNLIAGLILLLDRSIKPGDVIAVGDTFGWVNKIGVRAVSVLTRDGKEHLIPNELLMTEEVENWSFSSRDVRVHVGFHVSFDCDLRLAQRLAVDAASISPRVLKEPAPVCWIKAFGDNGVEFDLRIWIDSPESGVGNVTSDVFFRIWDLFKEHGVTMPVPQRDLRFRPPLVEQVTTSKPQQADVPGPTR
ncbi:MAG: mechanosensitive ion channel [Sphingobium sp.]|uniref:mechanosensitive ion channel family protein n=1 Tax=Sphingobium sp. TaxID=1912891 RepID=UPI0029B1D6E1|nr:mechanosensitive ion channel domain-containing protein [Sphingobium sp.]MDX3910142.1 mechanosensitive ion channel [Sphingobium sp.]